MTKPDGIHFHNLNLGYNPMPVVENITGFIPKGTMTAIVGPNGGGKTTLFKTLMGHIKPLKGHIGFKGMTHSVAYLAQNQTIDTSFPLSVFDIVSMGLLTKGMSSCLKKNHEEIMEALKTVGLASYASSTLSSRTQL